MLTWCIYGDLRMITCVCLMDTTAATWKLTHQMKLLKSYIIFGFQHKLLKVCAAVVTQKLCQLSHIFLSLFSFTRSHLVCLFFCYFLSLSLSVCHVIHIYHKTSSHRISYKMLHIFYSIIVVTTDILPSLFSIAIIFNVSMWFLPNG